MPPDAAFTTDLRSLFRDSEARAARLKLLIGVSRDLAAADGREVEQAVDRATSRAALFAGYARGAVQRTAEANPEDAFVIPLEALAGQGRPGVRLVFTAPLNPGAISTQDDAETLRLLVEMIEARLTVDLQQRRETELRGRLERRERELEQVLSRVVTAQESERAAISADLHDGVAQQVAALHRRLELLRLDLEGQAPDGTTAEMDALIGVARQSVADLRGVISGLRPTSLDDLGVVAALKDEARRLEAAGHAVTVYARLPGRLPDWQETLLFRIGQEALNNVAKHAPGASVRLDIGTDTERGDVILSVEDRGGPVATGVTQAGTPRFGLEIMRERLAAVAGTLEAAATATGFRIRATVPSARR
ncbi:sensor histidine kinase [Brevundimonas subvibrioides]|uniref:histidine kinase n=1 Tax=Brevundimonas subvibrioides (strain ATCC 15264 / DSM 4735 / LMG 14903 / NBRC 16000 / CB 81) TaxID=633149 RepID=D9QLQ7_BRESC|nr:histidine kinase [Brevundimonas subvibrioides]ADK99990.1 histidine kinase [Brevundimonas subvibrioides ATCC 15264]